MEIKSIIREVLTHNDFVSLPGIGSFIQKYEPARLSSDGTALQPPRQTVTFDSTRVFNDEAIENYICKTTGVNHTKAAEQLAGFIEIIRDELNKGNEITFQNVGSLKKDPSGVYQFKQAPSEEFASHTYGLTSVETRRKAEQPIAVKVTPTAVKPADQHKTKKLKTGSIVAVSLIGVFVLVIIAFALIPGIRFWQLSPVADLEEQAKKTSENQIIPNVDIQQNVDSSVNQTIESKTEKKAALFYEEPKIQDNKTYYVIAGSFGVLENAQKLSERLKQNGYSAEILQGGNMYRVSIFKTTDRNAALTKLTNLRNDKPKEKFWLLGL